jgi:hypothetical protein
MLGAPYGKSNEHLKNIIAKVTKHLGILRKLKFSLNRSNLEKLMGKPVTILAVSNWSFSNLSE